MSQPQNVVLMILRDQAGLDGDRAIDRVDYLKTRDSGEWDELWILRVPQDSLIAKEDSSLRPCCFPQRIQSG